MDNNFMMNEGSSYDGNTQPAEQSSTNIKAILSLVFGILSIILCCCYGIIGAIVGIVGIVMAVLSKKDNMGRFSGMAIAGLVCSVIGVVLGAIYLILWAIGSTVDPRELEYYLNQYQ